MSSSSSTINIQDSAPSPPTIASKWYEKKGLLLSLTSMAMFLDIVNVSAANITLPQILHDVGFKPNQLQWVVSAYALAYSAFLLLGGRLGDHLGHRRIFLLGVSWFTFWSLITGFANSPIFMSVGRAMQGMGAGFTIPSALALITTTYPAGPERTQAIAVFGGTGAVGSVVGVLMGGIMGSTIGWRWIFFITAIVGGLTSISAFFVIPTMTHIPPKDSRIDWAGAFTFTAGIVAIVYYLSEGPSAGWAVTQTLVPFVVGVVCLIAFVIIELRIEYPIMPFRIFQSRRFVASTVTAVFISMCVSTFFFFTSLTFQNILGYSAIITACAFIVHGIGLIGGVMVLTKILKFARTKVFIAAGWLLILASVIVWAQVQLGDGYWKLPFPGLILSFLGMVPLWVLSQVNSVADAADEDQGLVGAVYNVALQVGGPIGIAIANVVVDTIIDPNSATGDALMPGYSAAFYCIAGFSGLGFLAVLILAPNQDPIPTAKVSDLELAKSDTL